MKFAQSRCESNSDLRHLKTLGASGHYHRSAGLRPGVLAQHLRSRRVGDRRSGGNKTRPKRFNVDSKSLAGIAFAAATWAAGSMADEAPNEIGWSTNGPAVYALVRVQATKASVNGQPVVPPRPEEAASTPDQPASRTNRIFDHFLPGSLNN